MIGFPVGILIPLYKHNVRLSAYYLAQEIAMVEQLVQNERRLQTAEMSRLA